MIKIQRIFILSLLIQVFLSPAFGLAETPPATPDVAVPEITNLSQIAKDMRLNAYKGRKFKRKIKVGILDRGFAGFEKELGKTLPKATFHPDAPKTDGDEENSHSFHGTFLAKLVAQMIQQSGVDSDYELYLLDADGYSKFQWATQQAIEGHFDLVLYSQVWDFGGNGNGKGFINAVVDKALKAGVVWINAAGNYGRQTRFAPVDGKVESAAGGSDEWVVFKSPSGKSENSLTVICQTDDKTPCNMRLLLAWNDFADDPVTGTTKDLDLFLYDKDGKKLVASSEKIQFDDSAETDQDKKDKLESDKKYSHVPRELIEQDVPPGTYKIRVKIKSKNFSASQDNLWVTASRPGVELVNPSKGETLFPPADNPGVIVIGARDDLNSSESKKLKLPEVFYNSLVMLKGIPPAFETSNSAAMAVALATIEMGLGTDTDREAVLAKLKTRSQKPDDPKAVDAAAIKMSPPGVSPSTKLVSHPLPASNSAKPSGASLVQVGYCLTPRPVPYMYSLLQSLLARGRAVQSVRGNRPIIAVGYDFWAYMQLVPHSPEDRLVIGPDGVRVVPEATLYGLPADVYEVVSTLTPVCE